MTVAKLDAELRHIVSLRKLQREFRAHIDDLERPFVEAVKDTQAFVNARCCRSGRPVFVSYDPTTELVRFEVYCGDRDLGYIECVDAGETFNILLSELRIGAK